MEFIDFRSDTVTHPTQEMRHAMMTAEVGDDVYGDDLTTIQLQNYAAELLGKEGTLFVPSGCFGNTCCIYTLTEHGNEVICDHNCHIVQYEAGSSAIISGVQLRCINTNQSGGLLTVEQIDELIRKTDWIVYPKTRVITIEQPTSKGKVYPLETLKAIYELAQKYNIKVHMDGARVFNAASYLKCDVKEITQYCDTLMMCLSKGLCCGIGSLIAGSKEFINKALYSRKMLGGGMRQVGILAAPGLIALKVMIHHLQKDHDVMNLLIQQLKTLPLDIEESDINMVFFKIRHEHDPQELIKFMLERKIKMPGSGHGWYRLMTHHYIRENQIQVFIEALKEFLNK